MKNPQNSTIIIKEKPIGGIKLTRLNLDFSLETNTERKAFIDKYLSQDYFIKNPPTPKELETCANYILWGKDSDGKNPVQKKEILIDSKNKTWSRLKEEESLDALMEAPTFNEAIIKENVAARPKIVKENFSRSKALENAPKFLLPIFQSLFRSIDETELVINFYELFIGKRTKEPRADLLNVFTPEEISTLRERARLLDQYRYLKLRHDLVELRREQYTLRDAYSTPVQHRIFTSVQIPQGPPVFDADVGVRPLGLLARKDFVSWTPFRPKNELNPSNFSEEELEKISHLYWAQKELRTPNIFDFRELEHVYELLAAVDDLEDSAADAPVENTTARLLDTLGYYICFANLDEIHKDILDGKIKHQKNQDIADFVNEKYGKSYTANYISTIYRQKIIKRINTAAAEHEQIVSNLFFEENFKRCSACGEYKLRDANYFIRKAASKDGLSNRCKVCDKKARAKSRI